MTLNTHELAALRYDAEADRLKRAGRQRLAWLYAQLASAARRLRWTEDGAR